ncbi:hypothetical protein K439DRAFT_635379 [Ramaria rubella]|nr:hypothetical protein K439DRAFT_635379 [Ramaria rubella]
MTSTSLQFGPEWMRNKQQTTPSATRPQASLLSPALPSTSPPAPGASSYSSLLTSAPPAPPEKQDSVNPFKYSKEEMLQVWKDGGGHGGLGLEVELWEGVVREVGGEPIGLKEMGESERKLFSLPLNSDLRRRQSHDFLPNLSLTTDRPKLSHSTSGAHSPLSQQRFGALLTRKRKDDGIDGGPPLPVTRRLSLGSISLPLGASSPSSPTGAALPYARNRLGSSPHVLDFFSSSGEGSWRKREADPPKGGSILDDDPPVEEQDEEAADTGDTSCHDVNGSFSMANVSRRSMAPSPPSFRDDSGGQHAEEDLVGTLSGLVLQDEENKSNATVDVQSNPPDIIATSSLKSGISAARPPGLEDDASNVNWSYRDPKGNIQGPFTATLMQKWYDEGYFTPDLLMKRTHLDTDWTPVGELSLRAGNEKLFFSTFLEQGPPGLTPRPSVPPTENPPFDRFGGLVAARTSTLDPYLSSSSNQSQSPASFAAGIMPSTSPDLAFGLVGGRTAFGNGVEPTFGRISSFEPQPTPLTARPASVGFGAPTDPPYGPRLSSLNQRPMFETQTFNPLTNPIGSPWAAGSGNISRSHESDGLGPIPMHGSTLNNGTFSNSPVTNVPGFGELGGQDSLAFGPEIYGTTNSSFTQLNRGNHSMDSLSTGFGPIGPGGVRDQSLRSAQDIETVGNNIQIGMDNHLLTGVNFANGFSPSTPPVPSQGSAFELLGNHVGQGQLVSQHVQQQPQHSIFGTAVASPVPSTPGAAVLSQQFQQNPTVNVPATHPPWGLAQPSPQPRPRPFDTPHPTSRNVVKTPIPANEAPSFNRPQGQLEPSDWYNSSKSEIDDGWGDISTNNPSPMNQSIDASSASPMAWNPPSRPNAAPFDRDDEQASSGPAPRSTPPPPQPQPREPALGTKKEVSPPQPSHTAVKSPVTAPSIPMASAPKPPSPLPTVTQAKPAWSTPVLSLDDEKALKQTGLREIQEAEARKVEARKLAEREKERATRAQPGEETQSFTASWGLPTSQAGTARPTPKEQALSTPTLPSVAPVWTNAVKPPQTKQTMKEIQEEEERRKKAVAKDRETAAAAARRAYADSANKVSPSPPVGGVWTTVGSGGKGSTNSVARQVPANGQVSPLSQTTVRSTNGTFPARTASASSLPKASASKPATADEGPVPPSPEFMKWLREAVRGFNAGFNTEEFMAMLLTFSLDFPPSTVEVIQEMVYMNSTTLDGRRFAADFCAKRKADAANRPKGWATTSGKPPSLADVVKTQPKPAQSELPFKMVKKKGRGNALR